MLVRGLLPSAHLQWVREYYGERVAIRVLSVLPPEAAVEVNGAIPSGWCSFESLLLLDNAIAEVCGRDVRQTWRDLGRYTAQIRSDVHRFLRCTAVRNAYTYMQEGPNRGTMIAENTDPSNRAHCAAISSWLEHILNAYGAQTPTVNETLCRASGADRCAYELRWT